MKLTVHGVARAFARRLEGEGVKPFVVVTAEERSGGEVDFIITSLSEANNLATAANYAVALAGALEEENNEG